MNTRGLQLTKIDSLIEQRSARHMHVVQAIDFLVKTLPVFDHNEVYVSFNGGKDATVVLILTYLALRRLYGEQAHSIKSVYFTEQDSFEEVDTFIKDTRALLNLEMVEQERCFKESLKKLVTEQKLRCVIMGSRRTDPYCQNLEKITPSDTDKGYPPFLRINPIIDWTYEQVWIFLTEFEIPYCKLYEQGYSYLGNKKNTVRNPQLKIEETGEYKHAKFLEGMYENMSRKD